MHTRIQRSATLLLAVFTVGGVLLPLAHEFTHVRSLEHRHGRAAADIALGTGDVDALEFLVEEQTVPHNPNCELCARLSLDSPPLNEIAASLRHVDENPCPAGTHFAERVSLSRSIRAPPVLS